MCCMDEEHGVNGQDHPIFSQYILINITARGSGKASENLNGKFNITAIMKEIDLDCFYRRLGNRKEHRPFIGQIELTYRCNLNCIHCYCKGLEDKEEELNTFQWKTYFDEIRQEGCIFLGFTGGDPLIRDDFLELYSYARKKGFITRF